LGLIVEGFQLRKGKIGAGVCVKDVNVFQIVLAVAASNDVQIAANQGHGVASSCFRCWVLLRLVKVINVFPGLRLGVKSVEVVKTESMRATASK